MLLDTCAAIWLMEDAEIAEPALDRLLRAERSGEKVQVSPITAWEIGLLSSRGRLIASASPHKWFSALLDLPQIALAEMPPQVLVASSLLPGKPPRDPADRIIAATAREFGLAVMTRDRALLAYSEAGHMRALPC